MSLRPSQTELTARARADLRMGLPVVIEIAGQAALVVASETLGPARLADLRGFGQVILAVTPRRAATLKARAYSDNVARVIVPEDEGVEWITGVADPADDLRKPMKGPLLTERGGDDRIATAAIVLAKSAMLLPAAVMVSLDDGLAVALEHGLTRLDLTDAPAEAPLATLAEVVSARVPLEVSEAGRLHIYRPEDGGEEHYAVEIGRPYRDEPVLARLHSACFTGDLLGSLKCDCGPQLRAALGAMGANGTGVLLYLNQEGRGIGLANKMRAYSLQDQGFDTVEANHRLGFEDDERDFRIGSEILKKMGFSSVRLMTNNPAKVAMMEAQGIRVAERVPLKVGRGAHNTAYLDTKAAKSGHLL
ncbi:GTP cyclohydrolase II [Maritimibacter sp. DP1N21-5]|uniref:GTP cyclohydrolase II n=1 Tax=Maritimibacter sp. DP1N21-5 TaxID=2836867 RepID=UPI001C44D3F5|nr:GTP cyclohydrolase II [Maritimibacter sp. DP1N21-5]MBV7408825.1 GTP cyclohydrolase II [Maritimibacter sp. DP1N21-5]